LTASAETDWALATTDKDYRIESQWLGRTKSDIYIVSTRNGQHKQVVKGNAVPAYLSPNGDYVIYFNSENSNWYSYNIGSDTTNPLNDVVPLSIVDGKNDVPSAAGAYGVAGWSADGHSVYLYDRYDIWKFSVDGRKKSILTQSQDGQQQTIYRLQIQYRKDDPRKPYT